MIFNLLKGDEKSGLIAAGAQIDQVSYMIAAIFAGLFVAIVFGLSIKPLFKADMSKLKETDVAAITSQGGTKFNKRQEYSSGIFVSGAFMLCKDGSFECNPAAAVWFIMVLTKNVLCTYRTASWS